MEKSAISCRPAGGRDIFRVNAPSPPEAIPIPPQAELSGRRRPKRSGTGFDQHIRDSNAEPPRSALDREGHEGRRISPFPQQSRRPTANRTGLL